MSCEMMFDELLENDKEYLAKEIIDLTSYIAKIEQQKRETSELYRKQFVSQQTEINRLNGLLSTAQKRNRRYQKIMRELIKDDK